MTVSNNAKCISALITFFLMATAYSQTFAEEPEWTETVEGIIDKTIEEKQIVGMSVAVLQNGKIVFERAYGLASLELNVPAKVDTVYPISSVSKIFAGLVAMRLVEDGKLDLDASIRRYLPKLPTEYEPITPRHLLSHTHGLTDHYQDPDFEAIPEVEKSAMTGDDIMLWKAPRLFQFRPGEGWQYGLLGYVILERIFETIEGKSYEKIVGEHIFRPFQMNRSEFGGTERVVAGRNPVLYELVDGKIVNHEVHFSDVSYSAGGLNSPVSDLAKLFKALENNEIISGDSRREMWTPFPVPGSKLDFYGLGWSAYRRPSTGRFVVGHEGGGNAWVYYWPEERIGVIALSNMSGARADALPFEITAAILQFAQ